MSVLLGAVVAGSAIAAMTTEADAVLAGAAEQARQAASLLPAAPPADWRGAASAAYAERLTALRTEAAGIAPQLEDARRLVLATAGGGILG